MHAYLLSAVVALSFTLAGCGGGDGLVTVAGKVTYEGQPIEEGRIDFVPEDGKGPTASVAITAGNYSLPVAKGKKIVNVVADKVTAWRLSIETDPNSKKIPLKSVPIVPKKYNDPSELRNEVTGSAMKDFALAP